MIQRSIYSLVIALLVASRAMAGDAPPPAPQPPPEQTQVVKEKAKKVVLDEKIDHIDEEIIQPEWVFSIGNGKIKIQSKTFNPPADFLFALFDKNEKSLNTHVDIKDDTTVMGERL